MQSFKILVTSGSLLAIFACSSGNGDGSDAGVNNLTISQSAPNNAEGAPNNSQGAPNDSQGAPNDSQGAPNNSQAWPPNLPSSQPTTVIVVETDGGIDNQTPACSTSNMCSRCANTCDVCKCGVNLSAFTQNDCDTSLCPAVAGATCTQTDTCMGCTSLCDLCNCAGTATTLDCSTVCSV